MRFELEPKRRDVPDEDLIKDLMRVGAAIGSETVTVRQYNDNGIYSAETFRVRFGSWFKALELAGLSSAGPKLNISDEELLHNLAEVWLLLGRQPKYRDIRSSISKYSPQTYSRAFGSYRNALERFVAWANEDPSFEAPIPQDAKTKKRTPRNANWRQRAQVLLRDGATCKMCGARPEDGAKLHVDHIVPYANGGETVLENLQILCEQCNIGKSNLDPGQYS